MASVTARENKAATWDGIFYNLLFFCLSFVKNMVSTYFFKQ
jgi:hypothetical protein